MKIIQIHNKYQFAGGEDVVYEAEKELLEKRGHTLIRYERNNKEIEGYSFLKKSALLWQTTWSQKSYKEISVLIDKEKPHICHIHNFLPLISPSVYYACQKHHIPVVQTLHNYRLLCSNAYLFRNGNVCEQCLGSSLYHSVKYGCYRNSIIQTFALAGMVEKHKRKGTWQETVDIYIALTKFAKNKFVQGGLPEDKIVVKPNFLMEDPLPSNENGNYFFFAGRLDETKGIHVLLNAAKKTPSVPFKIAGEGPLKNNLTKLKNVELVGFLTKKKMNYFMKKARAVLFPSLWYEGLPMVIIEAFANAKPVIASNMGAMAEIIKDGETGLLFNPGDAQDLAKKLKWAIEHKEEMKRMGRNARKEFEEKYTAEKNYAMLMDIYQKAIENNRA